MMISTKGRYALRVMLDLADHNTGEYIPLKDIAQRQEISVKYLENILASLSRANLVDAIRGKGGGYRLCRAPEAYAAGEIIVLDLLKRYTVKRILKSKVYLGHTILGKSRKVSLKSKKKVPVPKDDWAVTIKPKETLAEVQRTICSMSMCARVFSVESLYVRSVVTHSVPVVRCIRGSEKNIGFFHAPTNVKILPTHVQEFA